MKTTDYIVIGVALVGGALVFNKLFGKGAVAATAGDAGQATGELVGGGAGGFVSGFTTGAINEGRQLGENLGFTAGWGEGILRLLGLQTELDKSLAQNALNKKQFEADELYAKELKEAQAQADAYENKIKIEQTHFVPLLSSNPADVQTAIKNLGAVSTSFVMPTTNLQIAKNSQGIPAQIFNGLGVLVKNDAYNSSSKVAVASTPARNIQIAKAPVYTYEKYKGWFYK